MRLRDRRDSMMAASTRDAVAERPYLRVPTARETGSWAALSQLCLLIAIAMFFLVSPMLLTNLGLKYAGAGGGIFDKLHPATWFVFAAVIARVFAHHDLLQGVADLVFSPLLVLFYAAWALLLGFTIVVQKQPFTPLIDTFLLPPLFVALSRYVGPAEERRLCILLHVIMNANALLGLFEFKTGFRLTPDNDAALGPDIAWRATALLGHPLGNALMGGCYVLIVALSDRCHLRRGLAPLVILVQILGLVSFGGRASLVVTLVLLCGIIAYGLLKIVLGARFSRLGAAATIFAVPILILAFAVLAQAGFFDQMLQRFVEDNGSAKARIAMLQMFHYVNLEDLMFGPDPAYMWILQLRLGIEYGIESFWVSFLFQYGAVMSGIFFLALFGLTWLLITMTRPATSIVFLYFYFVASTSVSMSAKTPMFAMLIFMIAVMMRAPVRAKVS
jgi:hypothetical protein